jgi:threonine/homoserine/homoserine lactone efflux protein
MAAPVGPVNIEVIKRGLQHGFFPAFLTSLGAVSADTTYLLIVYIGLAHFISIPLVKISIWCFGAIVLLWLGYHSINQRCEPAKPMRRGNSFVTGYLITISNPMTIVWWLGVFGSLLASRVGDSIMALITSLTIVIGIVLWFFMLSLLLHWGSQFVNETTMKWISVIGGVVLIGFGLYFGYNAVFLLNVG